ncbi:MAG: HlyD family efflux transporter periplasmic adaptor subunit [Xanthomonadales bacterium]|nr:HlyD family efflux transporter periplasmic adaptor subunit [Xanthomonadales bacterium]
MKQRTRWALLLGVLVLAGCQQQQQDLMVGTLERERIELQTESNEPIAEVHVADGAHVAAGDAIVSQDPRRHQARLALAEAQAEQAAARLAELRRGPRQEAIRESQARLNASQALTRDARADLDRVRQIFERGLTTESDLDNARTQFEAASAREAADREALAALLSGTTVEELQQAEAALKAAQAGVQEARLALERVILTAPVAGRVDRVLYEPGERPAPGTTVAVLLDESRSYARVYVPEHLKAQVGPGAPLTIRIDGVDRDLAGTVRWVSSDASFTPYFALTEHDRSRLSYLAEVDIEGAEAVPTGLPLEAWPPETAEAR